jgi:hypothetical protein
MPNDPRDEYLKRRDEVARLQRDYDRAQGAYDRELKALKDDHGCVDEKAAETLLKRLGRETAALETELTAGLAAVDAELEKIRC